MRNFLLKLKKFFFNLSIIIFTLSTLSLVIMYVLDISMGVYVGYIHVSALLASLVVGYICRPEPVRSILDSTGKVVKTTD